MRPQEVLTGALWLVFFLVLFQGTRWFVQEQTKLSFLCNAQGPFGIALQPLLLAGGVGIATFFLLWQWWHEEKSKKRLIWVFLIAAGGSNLLERLLFGCVTDYIGLPVGPWFNMADVVLSVSVILLVWWEYVPPVSRSS